MGKRGRPSKAHPILLLKSQPEVQTSATAIDNNKLDPPKSNTSHAVRKKVKNPAIIRKSPRMHNTVANQELTPVIRLEPVTHEIYIGENQNGFEPLQHEEINSIEVASRAEETDKCSKDNPGVSEENYKTMYMCSQKKIEALLEENRQLSKALEFANGKVHGYEKQGDMYSKVVAVIASLSRVNENLSARVSLGVSDEKNEECDKRNS